MDDRELQEIRSAIEHGREQAARGEGMTVNEAKERTVAAILRVQAEMVDSLIQKHNVDISPALMAEVDAEWPKDSAMNESIRAERDRLVNDLIAEIGPPTAEEAKAIDDLMASGERIAKRDAEALWLLAD